MFLKTIDFAKFSSIKVGQPTEVMVLEKGDKIPTDRVIIGHANNLLISPNPPPLMMLSKDFSFIDFDGKTLIIGCATPTGKMVSFAKKNSLGGFEFMSNLPGSLGGLIAMNGGLKSYETFKILDSVKINGRWIKKDKIEHDYRFAKLNGVATEAKFEITKGFDKKLANKLKKMRQNQPKGDSAGSVFKNPKGDYAGRLIDSVGLKGASIGYMQWSEIHANFLINRGGGKFDDAKKLIDLAKDRVFSKFQIRLEEEVRIL